jgi:hypothetical protein
MLLRGLYKPRGNAKYFTRALSDRLKNFETLFLVSDDNFGGK